MQAVAFDTLKLAQKLEKAGFPSKQAQDASAALAEIFTEWQGALNLCTREDIKLEIRQLELAIQKLEAQTSQRFAEVYQRIAEGKTETIKWVVGMAIALAGFMAALIKL
jgi:hypothetical protein